MNDKGRVLTRTLLCLVHNLGRVENGGVMYTRLHKEAGKVIIWKG